MKKIRVAALLCGVAFGIVANVRAEYSLKGTVVLKGTSQPLAAVRMKYVYRTPLVPGNPGPIVGEFTSQTNQSGAYSNINLDVQPIQTVVRIYAGDKKYVCHSFNDAGEGNADGLVYALTVINNDPLNLDKIFGGPIECNLRKN